MKRFYTILIYLLLHGFAYGQTDLLVNTLNINTNGNNPVFVGNTITGTLTVKNAGNVASGKCFTSIYISPTTDYTKGFFLGKISLQSVDARITTSDIIFNYPIPYTISNDSNYSIIVYIDESKNLVDEPNKANNSYAVQIPAQVKGNQSARAAQNLPYPIIFVHGVNSNNDTWNVLIDSLQKHYGWGYGGNMNFSLNYDGNLKISDKATDYKDFTYEPSLRNDDYYTVNFDVDKSGAPLNSLSVADHLLLKEEGNQSAIVKQGLAIKDAIRHVLTVTKKNKVILVGHSMGGLASREYLQNQNLWNQPNINHDVAKLLSVGTPHGGSNFGELGLLGNLVSAFKGLDLNSEAVRDLRINYNFLSAINIIKGAYLSGGNENTIKNYIESLFLISKLVLPYNNYDIDCNGNIGDEIIGLNKKDLPDLPYSCIIGTGDPLGGDGVVSEESADLNKNFAIINADTYSISKINSFNPFEPVLHTDLPKEFRTIIQGLDEPNYLKYAYNVNLNKLYYGNFTLQSIPNNRDDDNYAVNIVSNGKLNIQVFNIPTSTFTVSIFSDKNLNVNNPVPLQSFNSNGKSYLNLNVPVSAGKYYVVLSGNSIGPDTWKSQYAFQLSLNTTPPTYPSCFTNLTATTGSFSDGSGSANYANNTNCSWLINPSGVSSITLRFNNFNTEAINDVVNIYDGNDNTYPLLAKYSGNSMPASVTSTGSTMFVEFITNSNVTAAGWDATYTSTVSQNSQRVPTYTTGYKYWFDGDISNNTTVTQSFSNSDSVFTLLQTPSSFKTGFHSVSFMVQQSDKSWSVPLTNNFYYVSNGAAASYEYWFDSTYSNKQLVQITNSTNLMLTC